jgi:hypothetical protein
VSLNAAGGVRPPARLALKISGVIVSSTHTYIVHARLIRTRTSAAALTTRGGRAQRSEEQEATGYRARGRMNEVHQDKGTRSAHGRGRSVTIFRRMPPPVHVNQLVASASARLSVGECFHHYHSPAQCCVRVRAHPSPQPLSRLTIDFLVRCNVVPLFGPACACAFPRASCRL